jgi:hypothetical protein
VNAHLFITPPIYIADKVGEVFGLSVNVSNVKDLRQLEFILIFNASLLDVINVTQGSFFPLPPNSNLEFEKAPGYVRVRIYLTDSEAEIGGNGTVVYLNFKAIYGPEVCAYCTLNFNKSLLLNSALTPIAHDSVGAVYFWKSMLADPSVNGGCLDLYTQKGGVGCNQSGGDFVVGEVVHLISKVTYNNAPVQNKLVAFEVLNPLGEAVLMRTAVTNEYGLAIISFKIPYIPSSNGTWTAISTVSIADKVVWDIITFQVRYVVPVGGYTTLINVRNGKELITEYYLITIIILTITLITIKRETE